MDWVPIREIFMRFRMWLMMTMTMMLMMMVRDGDEKEDDNDVHGDDDYISRRIWTNFVCEVMARAPSPIVFGVRYKDCGVFGTTFIESSYDSSSLPSACCRNKRNKTKRNFIWAFCLVPKHWRPGRVLSTLLKTDTTCVTSTKCPSREESSKVSKKGRDKIVGAKLLR